MNTKGWYKILMAHWHSVEWRTVLRPQRLAIDGYQCRNCDEKDGLEVHHWLSGYRHVVNGEAVVMDDLITLCHLCHHSMTNRHRNRGYWKHTPRTTEYERSLPIVDSERQATQLILVDVVVRLPLPAERITRHGAFVPDLQDYRRSTPDRA